MNGHHPIHYSGSKNEGSQQDCHHRASSSRLAAHLAVTNLLQDRLPPTERRHINTRQTTKRHKSSIDLTRPLRQPKQDCHHCASSSHCSAHLAVANLLQDRLPPMDDTINKTTTTKRQKNNPSTSGNKTSTPTNFVAVNHPN